ncbi:hypothetical protein QZH41_010396 [Actinostola sp. cb2023]|nr:hypothetical protein QZH41_010396 [Actinostola sp. cb2023]
MAGYPVKLYIYEISNGLARQMSPLLLGKQIDGIWHTGVVCFGKELFYGGGGIEYCLPSGTVLGEPDHIIDLGDTQIPEAIFTDFLKGLGAGSFRSDKYHLFDHNCNNFSNELTVFLTGKKIPKQIRILPHEVVNSAFGQMIKPIIDSMTVTPAGGSSVGGPTQDTRSKQATSPNTQNPSSAKSSGAHNPESIFEPRENHNSTSSASSTSELKIPAPMYFQAKDVKQDIIAIREALKGNKEERRVAVILNNVETLIMKGKKVTISDDHISCIENIFHKLNGEDSKTNVLELLKALTLEKSFINHSKVCNVLCSVISDLLLCISKQDYSTTVVAIQVLCNAVSTKGGHDVLLSNTTQPNLTAVITNCLLEEDQNCVQMAASELAFNVARYKVSDEIGFEYSTAILEVMNRNLDTNTRIFSPNYRGLHTIIPSSY